ncbi:MAG: DNA translocase FtsK [Bacilli bacterium]|nr:DNA translocase FtsK [Bacilli bacterium]
MARKKKKKEVIEEEKVKIPTPILGVVYILLGIFGIGTLKPLGIVGQLVRIVGIFFFGKLNLLFCLALIALGLYVIIKKEHPRFFDMKFIGLYILLIGILVFLHIGIVKELNGAFSVVMKNFFDNFVTVSKGVLKNNFNSTGGGLFGAFFGALFKLLFDYQGTYIVSIVIMLIGFSLFTGFSILDYKRFSKLKDKMSNLSFKKEEIDYDEETGEVIEETEELSPDERIVISSIEELKETVDKKLKNDSRREELDQDAENKFNEALEGTGVIQFSNNRVSPKYILPDINKVLNKLSTKGTKQNEDTETISNQLIDVLQEFGISNVRIVDIHIGPSVTQYELAIGHGTKLSKIVSLNKEISLALAKKDVRIQAPIPGKSTIGIEVANQTIQPVAFREVFEKLPENKANSKLLVVLGKNIMGEVKWAELDKTPHLLVAGATGSGKSVCINCIITSILMRTKPDEVKLVMVDPKKVELSNYNGVPHLLTPVVTDPKKASIALQKIVHEMENRYDIFEETKVKNISTYNEMIDKKNQGKPDDEKIPKMPYIVVIIDELADLMLVAAKDVEDSIMRITQMARAAGIHLIVATQRPSTDVITGVVKANIPSRISFAVSSSIDSRTILDMSGAEKLLGKGDMLFLPMGENIPERIQGAFVSDGEIENVINWTVKQQIARYDARFENLEAAAEEQGNAGGHPRDVKEEYDDPIYNEVKEFVIEQGKASSSLIQRRFKVGFNRAATILDLLEERGVVGPATGNSKPREVLLSKDDLLAGDVDIDENE